MLLMDEHVRKQLADERAARLRHHLSSPRKSPRASGRLSAAVAWLGRRFASAPAPVRRGRRA
jgi:hypothetical protein